VAATARRGLGRPARTRPPGRTSGAETAKRSARETWWWTALTAGVIVASLPANLAESPPQARGWQAAAFDAVLAAVALTSAVVLAGALTALPALVRFLRAGGWPEIRRRVAWAAAATVVAGGGLAALVLGPRSLSSAQRVASWAYTAGSVATGLAIAVAIGLWATAVAATARHLTLAHRLRAVQLVLVAAAGVLAVLIPIP
jgi:hypothetical protein